MAVVYAAQHPGPAATEEDARYGDRPLLLAGPGAPGVAEFAIAAFAAALGMSTASGRTFLGQVPELRHRLPRLWTRLEDGEVTSWRARMVAGRRVRLSAAGARYVDAQVALPSPRPGVLLWSSPDGRRYLGTPAVTVALPEARIPVSA